MDNVQKHNTCKYIMPQHVSASLSPLPLSLRFADCFKMPVSLEETSFCSVVAYFPKVGLCDLHVSVYPRYQLLNA
jgi:hypothetical protein